MQETAAMDTKLVALRRQARRGIAGALDPLVGWLAERGLTPDQLSWAGFALAVAAGFLAGFRVFVAAGIVYLIVGVVDLLDGALARRTHAASARGAFLDSLLDRAGEGAVHAGAAVAFAYWGIWIGVLAVALSLVGSYLTSYARARAEGLGIALEEVWFGRAERLILLGFGLIFYFALIAFWILAVVGWLSAAHRAWLAWHRFAPPARNAGEVQTSPPEPESESRSEPFD
jgi:CDP-diacylglycerol--glycerol-3-phosphate 3-phosphatidyltransferase